MGDELDWILEQDWGDDDFDDESIVVPQGYWKTKEGKLLKITEMTDSHLNNIIKYFIRCKNGVVIGEIQDEVKRRHELMRKRVLESAMKLDPELRAFIAGWNAACKAASDATLDTWVVTPEVTSLDA